MEEMFRVEEVNPESAGRFAECISDMARLVKKMQDYDIKFVITQQASVCKKDGLKVATKLTMLNGASMDEVDIVVSEQTDGDEEIPFLEITTLFYDMVQCQMVSSFFSGRCLNDDMTLREIVKACDSSVMDELEFRIAERTENWCKKNQEHASWIYDDEEDFE